MTQQNSSRPLFQLVSFLRALLLALWFFICSGYGCLLAIFRFGDRSNNRRTAQLFGKFGSRIVGMQINVQGSEILETSQPCIYVCNHQNYFDLVIFGSIFPSHTVAIGKKELKWVPLFNFYFAGAGNFFVDRKNRTKAFDILAQTLARLKSEKVSVLFFPEGTRNWNGNQLLPFKKGAFHIAIQAKLPIVPVVIADTSSISSLHSSDDRGAAISEDKITSFKFKPWWKGRFSGPVQVEVLSPIDTSTLNLDQVGELTQSVRTLMQNRFSALPRF